MQYLLNQKQNNKNSIIQILTAMEKTKQKMKKTIPKIIKRPTAGDSKSMDRYGVQTTHQL